MNAWTNAENHYAVSDTEWEREVGAQIWLIPLGTDWDGVRSQRHTSQRIQIENAFKPTLKGQITFNLCTKLYLRSFSKERKNWQHCSQEFHWRTWIDSNSRQIAVLVPHCGQWNMGGVTCVTSEWRQEKPKCDSLVSLFFLPQRLHVLDGACARASLTTDVCRLWWVCVYVCICVCVCVCV